MKKLFIFLFSVLLVSGTMAQSLSGDYYIPNQSAGQNGYPSLSAALKALNANGMADNVTLYINDNITENEDVCLGVDTKDYTLTIKPQAGKKPTINLQNGNVVSGDASVITGSFVIGSPSASKTNMVYTNNLVIDGSNTEGGTTRDMVFQGAITTNQKSVFAIFGDNDNVTIKNCVIVNNSSHNSANACFIVTNYVEVDEGSQTSTDFSPDNLTIQNNELYSEGGRGSDGIYINNNGGTPSEGMKGLVIEGNDIYTAYRNIRVSYVDEARISGNTLSVNTKGSTNAAGILLEPLVNDTEGTIDIYNNKLVMLATLNSYFANNNGIMGIDCEYVLPKTVNIYNNTVMLTGPSIETAKDSRIYGIRSTGNATCNIYHNTVYIPEMLDMLDFGRSSIAGIVFGGKGDVSPIGGFTTVKNNIIVGEESTMKYWGILRIGNSGVFASDNNIFYCADGTEGYVGYNNESDAKSLADWQAASYQDNGSKFKYVNFAETSVGNLLLAEASQEDMDLKVPALPEVTTDILGNNRDNQLTFAGAHAPNEKGSSINQIKGNNIKVSITETGIEILLDKEADIRIYNINGILISNVRANNKYAKDLDEGVYIIQIGNEIFKVLI